MRTESYTKPAASTYHPSAPSTPLQDFGYAYDLTGNVLAIYDRTPGSGIQNSLLGTDALDRTFVYDPVYRLISATGRECDVPPPPPPWTDTLRCTDITKARSYSESYQYDNVGNMALWSHTSTDAAGNASTTNRQFALAPGNNQLRQLTVGSTPYQYSYDANGNLVRENTDRHFEWDESDRLRVFRIQPEGAPPSIYAQYLYDSSGQRVMKLVRNQAGGYEATIYIGSVFEHRRGVSGAAAVENDLLQVMNNKSRIAIVRVGAALPGDGAPDVPIQYHFGDHLGSTNVVVNDTGAWVNREEYLPYGETSFGGFARKRYRFTGKERDEESGLSYHGARYYAPWLARWASCDPLRSANPFYYGSGNPIGLVDPTGEASETPETGPYSKVQGDHIHQVAARTELGERESAPLYREALSVSTKDASYADKSGQKVERAFNRAMWGKDYDTKPAGKEAGRVTLRAEGETSVGSARAAVPSQWAEDQKSKFKIIEAGISPGKAADLVQESANQLQTEGATPKRVPDAPRNISRALRAGQELSPEMPLNTIKAALPTIRASIANTAADVVRTSVPGVAEAEHFLMVGAVTTGAAGYVGVAGAITKAAAAAPVVGGSAVVGAAVGNLAERAASQLGAGRAVSAGTGLAAAALSGMAAGALIGSAAGGIGAVPGAVVGGLSGLAGYYVSRWL
jgi:RHS repeat-associated protein